MDFKTLSKTDKLSLQLTSVDPAKPNLEPERSINYHTEESAVEMINDGYSVVYNLKDRECWDIQDYLQDNQETHSLFMLCKLFTVRIPP